MSKEFDPEIKVKGKRLGEWIGEIPALESIAGEREFFWKNPSKLAFDQAIAQATITKEDVADASARWQRFASYFRCVFPETEVNGGLIESPVHRLSHMQREMEKEYSCPIEGDLMIKLDSHLPVSGSIKARGGIYEVLYVAEQIAMREGGLKTTDDYAILATDRFKRLFSKYSIAVGSTGNLGLSIGIMSAKLGFRVTVHMSADAREWKKSMLREKGVDVVEYAGDYSLAVANGREQAKGDPYCHFIDDENSRTLFLGYSVAAERLKGQLEGMGIVISEKNPLHVYLPCGVGGGPGGVAFGLKLAFGDLVHCYFAEPTHAPCMVLGMATGLHDKISVGDLGIEGHTIADGLAVGRASGFVGGLMMPFIDGCYTVTDERMSALLAMLWDTEDIHLEPSALAGMYGVVSVGKAEGRTRLGTHLVWATGGGMVPAEELEKYYRDGKRNAERF